MKICGLSPENTETTGFVAIPISADDRRPVCASTLSGLVRIATLMLFLVLIPNHLKAQDWRLSTSYFVEHFDLNYQRFPTGEQPAEYTQKGGLELELERYLLHRLYVAVSANTILHNQETVFLGGPVDFNQLNLGASLGFQGGRFGIYGGVQAGRRWNLRFRGHQNGEPVTIRPEPSGSESAWTTAFRGGAKYYLLRYLRLHAELVHTNHLPGRIRPAGASGGTPEVSWAEFSPWSFRVGFSISIPWSGKRRVHRINETGRLPAVMELSGTNFQAPVENPVITSHYGSRWGRNHQGVDLRASRRDDVLASASGVVVEAGTASGYGQMILIRHANGYSTRYAHLSRIRVRTGQTVRRGDRIGRAGRSGSATGVHLHFELLRNGVPVDPSRYIDL